MVVEKGAKADGRVTARQEQGRQKMIDNWEKRRRIRERGAARRVRSEEMGMVLFRDACRYRMTYCRSSKECWTARKPV